MTTTHTHTQNYFINKPLVNTYIYKIKIIYVNLTQIKKKLFIYLLYKLPQKFVFIYLFILFIYLSHLFIYLFIYLFFFFYVKKIININLTNKEIIITAYYY